MPIITKQQVREKIARYYSASEVYFTVEDFPLKDEIPKEWVNLINQYNQSKEASPLVEWDITVNFLPNVVNFVKNYVFAYALLINDKNIPSLLYIYTDEDGQKLYFYNGGVPLADDKSFKGNDIWERFPPLLKSIYSYLHNGWVFHSDNSLGFLPLKECEYLSDKDWDIDEEVIDKYPFDLKNVVTILHNGAGDYLCLDLSKVNENNNVEGIIWWHERPDDPSLGVNFWDTFDAWFGIGVEGIDSKNISKLID